MAGWSGSSEVPLTNETRRRQKRFNVCMMNSPNDTGESDAEN